jgi:hypothetical protein
VGDTLNDSQLHQSICQQTQGPSTPARRRFAASSSNQVGFSVTVELAFVWASLGPSQCRFGSELDKPTADVFHGGDVTAKGICDVLIFPGQTVFALVGLEQDLGMLNLVAFDLAAIHKFLQPPSFFDAQFNNILFHGSLLAIRFYQPYRQRSSLP